MTHRDELRLNLPAALDGDPRAIERLLAAFRPLVARYCRARLGGPDRSFAAADRVARDACLAVLAALPQYPDQGRPFLAYLFETTTRVVAEAGGGPPRRHHPLDALPDGERDVLILRTLVGLTTDETAEATGMSPAGVRVAQHRALAKLRAGTGS